MRPYVIAAPPYLRVSAGIRALHYLCHLMNQLKIPAYMVLHGGSQTNPEWQTPLAPTNVFDDAIIVCPEIYAPHQLPQKRVVRWLLNRPLRAVAAGFGPTDYVVSYSRVIDPRKPVLQVCTSDPRLFNSYNLPPKDTEVFFIGKGTPEARDDALESGKVAITPWWPPTAKDLAELLRRSRVLLSYDPLSALNLEATLCGALCIVIPNGEFTEQDFERAEIPPCGIAWGLDRAEVQRAMDTLPQAYPNYLRRYERQPDEVLEFVDLTQQHFAD